MRTLYAIVSVVAMAGCASAGQDFSMAEVDAMKPGVTTLQDAVAKLGKPSSTNSVTNGVQIVSWIRVTSSPVGATSKSVAILFDREGRMLRVGSKSEMKTN
jgi:outer membrane murein-binding lipoprotein Lpp